MAVTKIWPVRGRVESPLDYAANEEKTANPRWDKSSLQNLTDVMHYAADEDKTEKQFFVSGVNCTPAIARDQFVIVKKQFDKEDGIVAYHGYQSFAEGEVTPELAHEIGLEFAERVWGEDYQVVVATHLNTKCFHNHFVINSVSFKHGKRLRAKQWYELNKVSDEICREHGLSIIENRRGKGIPKQLYYAERNGGSTRVNIAKAAVDEALAVSTNVPEFEMALKAKGYLCNFNPNHKHWTIWQKDWKRPIRLTRMGEDYTASRIMERLDEGLENKTFEVFQRAVVVRRKQYVLFTREDKIKGVGGLKGLYLHYCYLLGYLPKYKQQPTKVSPLLRDDLIKMEQIAKETRQLQDNESSPNEYASGQIEYGMQESAYIARQAAARAAPKVKDGTQKAIQSYRIRHARSQIKRQRVNSGRADSASASSIKLKQLAQKKAKSNQVAAARQTQKRMQQTAIRTAKAAKQSAKTTKQVVKSMLRAARAAAEGTKALITAIIAGGWAAVAVVLCCVIFGAAFYFFGDESSQSYTPVSEEVEAYTPVIQKYANEYGIGEYTDLIKAVMMQESGGRGKDPMQSSECGFNKKYPNKPNAIKDPDYSIKCGVQMLASVLKSAKCSSPVDMDRIKLALQGYNFGSGYITWAFDKYGGYSKANAIEYSKLQAKKTGASSYGDTEYVEHVLRYYPYGNYSYDVIFTGPGRLGLPIKGMTKNNISSHFGPRSSPGGIGSSNHQGLDIAFPSGTKVLACESGTVTKAGWYSGYGLCVIIDHGKGVQTLYAHLSKVNAKKGQKVVRGQYIGNVGSTGNSTGPHLHLGVMLKGSFVNPEKGWLNIP